MKKTIYDGAEKGLYFIGSFKQFLVNLEGAEKIVSKDHAFEDAFFVYHIMPQNVTLKYVCLENSNPCESSRTQVTLFGKDEASIGEIEKIILEEDKRERLK